jgi:hypothetical protein
MLLSRQQNAVQNHDLNVANRSFEIVAKLKYLLNILMNRNLIHEDIKSSLISGSACRRSD